MENPDTNAVTVEGAPTIRKTRKGNFFVKVWDGTHEVEIQFHADNDVRGIVAALGGGTAFRTEERDYGADKKWSEAIGPRARIVFRPTGKSEDGSAVFATAVRAEPVPLCTAIPGITL